MDETFWVACQVCQGGTSDEQETGNPIIKMACERHRCVATDSETMQIRDYVTVQTNLTLTRNELQWLEHFVEGSNWVTVRPANVTT